MNKAQRMVFFCYGAVIFLMVIYPPFYLKMQGFIVRSEYSWIWSPIMAGETYGSVPLGVLDFPKLLIQMLGATLISVASVIFLGSKSKREI